MMKDTQKCPQCPNMARLMSEIMPIDYRGKKHFVEARYYKCDSCGFEYTTTETDEYTLKQVYSRPKETPVVPPVGGSESDYFIDIFFMFVKGIIFAVAIYIFIRTFI